AEKRDDEPDQGASVRREVKTLARCGGVPFVLAHLRPIRCWPGDSSCHRHRRPATCLTRCIVDAALPGSFGREPTFNEPYEAGASPCQSYSVPSRSGLCRSTTASS